MNSEEIISEFKKKNRVTTTAGIIYIIVILVGVILWQIYNLQFSYVVIVLIGLSIPLNIFFYTYWNCPNCKSFLGSSYDIDECPNCHIRFEESNTTESKDYLSNHIANEIDSSNTNSYVENIATFPEYNKYNIYNLVEIYQRIDHHRNAKKIKIIEDLIRERLNIDPLIDFDSTDIQKQFSTIIENGKPKTIYEIENSEISKMLGWFQLALLLGTIATLLLPFLGLKSGILGSLGLVFFGVIIFIEFVKGFFKDEILALWRGTVSLKESPILFRFNQSLLIFFFILIVLGVFKSL